MHGPWIATLLLATGCQAVFGLDDPRPRDVDGGVDGSVEPKLCWGTDVQICLPGPASGSLDLSGSLDTATSSRCAPSITGYCVIAASQITIASAATLDVTGPRPLVLIANETITVAGTLDVAAHAAPRKPGPGASALTCPGFPIAPSTQGGGAGGTFAGTGGAGAGNNDTPPDTGGTPAAVTTVSGLRAGCPGQAGGGASNGFGLGGLGGGAVLLAAGAKIEIRGRVDASGAGGNGGACQAPCSTDGPNAYGGGGGGAGGMIVLEAPAIENTGVVYADGGGGGEGASRSQNGIAGVDPAGTAPALGGDGPATHGGNGGNGAFGPARNGAIGLPGDSSNPGGGGGGGGGAGVIRVHGAAGITGGGSVSPPPA